MCTSVTAMLDNGLYTGADAGETDLEASGSGDHRYYSGTVLL